MSVLSLSAATRSRFGEAIAPIARAPIAREAYRHRAEALIRELQKARVPVFDASLFRPGRQLGRGGMATVVEAEAPREAVFQAHPRVALKQLEPAGSLNAMCEAFLREASLGFHLRHPRILPTLGAIVPTDAPPALVLERHPYPSLRRHLLAAGPLSAERCVQLGRDLVAALVYLEEEGVVHRDISPENILLGPEGARLIDFGVAIGRNHPRPRAPRVLSGKPRYAAPEQLMGDEVDSRADQYALAASLFEAFVGQPHREGERLMEVISPPPAPSAQRPVHPMFDRVLMRMLSPERPLRYRDLDQLLADFDRLAAVALQAAPARPCRTGARLLRPRARSHVRARENVPTRTERRVKQNRLPSGARSSSQRIIGAASDFGFERMDDTLNP